MKQILITGAGSFVGTRVQRYLEAWPEEYTVTTLDMRDGRWKDRSFTGFDVVLHVAGLVHQKKTKDDPAQADLYAQVNTLLAIETARKAKAEGVGQFIFMSTESVYGLTAPIGKTVIITKDTPLSPKDNYGTSKAQAEAGIQALAGEGFRVVILRPPMIYGRGCKGNYQTMAAMAGKLPVFPKVNNQRSMLYIDNLAECIRLIIRDGAQGLFCPQNREYTNTSEMVRMIARARGRHLVLVPGFAWALKLLRPLTGAVDKAFGSLCYDRSLSDYPADYCVKSLETSILETEGVEQA